MKKILCFSMLFLFCVAGKSVADEKRGSVQNQMRPETAAAAVVNANNKTCPITGDPVNGKDFVVYKGKRYGLCCTGCDKQFLLDPEKYIKVLKDKGEIK